MVAKYWSFSFIISPSNDYLGLISFRIDWFDLLAFQGTFRSLFQHHGLKASVLRCSAFFYCQSLTFVQDYWKKHGFDYLNLFWQRNISDLNMLSRFVITFLPRSKCLLISWLQSASAGILEPKKIKSVTVSNFILY